MSISALQFLVDSTGADSLFRYLEYAIDSRYNFLDHIRKSVREQELMKEVNDFFDQDDVKQPDRISARHV